jgi:hypothetical protein
MDAGAPSMTAALVFLQVLALVLAGLTVREVHR